MKHALQSFEGWHKEDKSGALYKGTCWHMVLEVHYRAIKQSTSPKLAVIDYLATLSEEMAQLMLWMYHGYLEQYREDSDWEILGVEHQSVVPLIPGVVQLGFTTDLIIRWRGQIWIVDHKSCSMLPSSKDLDFHEQFTFYTWALRQLGLKVVGSIYSASRTKQNKGDLVPEAQRTGAMKAQTLDQRFYREMMNRGQDECDAAARDAIKTAELMLSSHNQRERHFNPDTCHWKCSFTEACLIGRKTNDDERTRQYLRDTGWHQESGGRYDEIK